MTNAYTQALAMALSSLPEAIAQTRNKQEGSAVLVMRSGVSEMNDQEIGAFRCGHTAELCGMFLLALDAAATKQPGRLRPLRAERVVSWRPAR